MVNWTDDFERLLHEQNPWLGSGEVPGSLAPPVERPLAKVLWRRLMKHEPHRFQVILGPRRVGKTTVLYQTVRHLLRNGVPPHKIRWWRLDHPVLAQVGLGDLIRSVLESVEATPEEPAYVMLDEVVYAEDWDRWLKTFHDDKLPVRIAATSSATALLRNRTVESGIGRWEVQHLMPYLFDEFLDLIGQPNPIEARDSLGETLASLTANGGDPGLEPLRRAFLLTGGFPELLGRLQPLTEPSALPDLLLESQRVLRSDAVERAIYKDIPQSYGVDNPLLLERLVYALAGQLAGLLSSSNLAGDLGLSQPTVDRYISYLERTFLVFAPQNYSGSEIRIQRRRRKLYFVDGAVRNAALQRGLAPLTDPEEFGRLMENLVASSLNTLAVHAGVRLYHWRLGNAEVDLVLDDPRCPVALEVASSLGHSRSGLKAFVDAHERFREHAWLVAPQAQVMQPKANATGTLPLDQLLLTIGAQAKRAQTERLG